MLAGLEATIRRELPHRDGPVRCCCIIGREVETALSRNGFSGARQDGGHRERVLEPHRAFIIERISQMPHLTLHGLKNELAARDVKVSHYALWTFLRREGLNFKKLCSPLKGRADVAWRRQRWRSLQDLLDPGRLVFIDET